jgi:hypothetical protein
MAERTKTKQFIPFTPEHREFFEKNYLYLSDKAIAEICGYKDDVTVRKIRQLLGLKRNNKKYTRLEAEVPIVVWKMKEKKEEKQ